MSDNTDTKLDPAAERAQDAEPRLVKQETELVTNPLHKDEPVEGSKVAEGDKKDDAADGTTTTTSKASETGAKDEGTDVGKDATKDATKDAAKDTTDKAGSLTGTIAGAASSTKDSLFSMFGGGSKEKKRAEPEDDIKDKAERKEGGKADAEVCSCLVSSCRMSALELGFGSCGADTERSSRAKRSRNPLMCTLNPSSTSQRRSRPRPMRRWRSRPSRCEPSCSDSIENRVNGRSGALVTSGS